MNPKTLFFAKMWNSRYSAEEYAYGEEPNAFIKQQLDNLIPGKILFPAEGEGRNAVYAAKLGWNVEAFDLSTEGREKALSLAAQNGVDISTRYVMPCNFKVKILMPWFLLLPHAFQL